MDAARARPTRRSVLGTGAGALAAVALGGATVVATARRADAVVDATLYALDGERTMIDGLVVPVVGFGTTADRVELPSGQLEVQTGDTVNLTVVNRSRLPVGLAVPGVAVTPTRPVAAGATGRFTFTAPAKPGTHFYVGTIGGSDPQHVETGKALGATGALVVLPRTAARTSLDALFPGVRAKGRRQPLFGTTAAAGIPGRIAQERTWLFAELNPSTARDLAGGRVALPTDPEPEYFLINGISGMLSVEDKATNITGRAGTALGQPGEATLVRMINTGRAPRSIHLHGNHYWVLRHPTSYLVGAMKDTVTVPSGRAVDVLVPLEIPSDSYPVTGRAQKYVVHDHIEMAETASGGHYPSGMVSELIFE